MSVRSVGSARMLLSWLVALSLAVALMTAAGPAGADTFEEQALSQARDRIASVENRLDAARDDAAAASTLLAAAEADLAALEEAVNQATAAVARQAEILGEAEGRLQALEDQNQRLRDDLASQLVVLHKHGSLRGLEALLAAADPGQAVVRAGYLQRIAGAEQAALQRVRASQIEVDVERDRVAAQREYLEAFREEQLSLREQAIGLRDRIAAQLREARQSVATLQAQRDDLASDAAALEALIRANQATPTSASEPSTAGYIWPVCGIVTSEFGWRWGRMHAGLDIDGDTGDAIAAAKAGVVIFAGWQGGYGNLILIDHGDGVVTAYAHQSAFAVGKGETVVRGQRIGSVGSTGRSTGPHLHFETRVHGDAVNPRRFLPSGC